MSGNTSGLSIAGMIVESQSRRRPEREGHKGALIKMRFVVQEARYGLDKTGKTLARSENVAEVSG